MNQRILLIDDDAELCCLITQFMAEEGFEVDSATDGGEGVRRAVSGEYVIILLDVIMPGLNGFDVLRRIRAQSPTPIMMLTAKGDTVDRVVGLEMGADDYLPKPFEPSELAARVRAIVRRARLRTGDSPVSGESIVAGALELDARTRTVRKSGKLLEVTTVEFDLLAVLMRAAGRTVSREDLFRSVLGREFSPFDRSIDAHVCNLRRKIGLLEDGTERIRGVRGAGYFYVLPSKPSTFA